VTKLEELQRNIETIRESVRLQWQELAAIPLSAAEHNAARAAILLLVDELKILLDERDFERANADRS
jgi:hypothetical protein